MSEENVEIVRGFHESFLRAGIDEIRASLASATAPEPERIPVGSPGIEPLLHFVRDHLDPDVEIELLASGFSLPDMRPGTALRGWSGWLEFWRGWLEPWEEFDADFGNFVASGDDVVVDITVSARGRESGLPVKVSLSQVWGLRDGKVRRVRMFDLREQALEAAGLSE